MTPTGSPSSVALEAGSGIDEVPTTLSRGVKGRSAAGTKSWRAGGHRVAWRAATPAQDFGVAGRIMPTPGHTAGSVSVLTDRGDLVAGDLIANSLFGLVRGRPANPPFQARQRVTAA